MTVRRRSVNTLVVTLQARSDAQQRRGDAK